MHGVSLRYFKFRPLDFKIYSLKYQKFTRSGCKDIVIKQLEFLAKLISLPDKLKGLNFLEKMYVQTKSVAKR